MPVPDFESYKVAASELSSVTKFNNLVQAVEDEFADIDADQVQAPYTTYVPAWTSGGTAPAIGNGSIAGRYVQIGKLVMCTIRLTAGTTTTFGTGLWQFSLPVTALAPVYPTGSAIATDTGVATYGGYALLSGTTALRVITPASPASNWDAAIPFAWGNTDVMDISVTYEAA